MLIAKRIRGPSLTVKLLLLGVVLLAVPWLSYHQLSEMEKLLLQGQQNAQLLMARGVSVLLNDRIDLFEELPVQLDEYESIYALPLYQIVRIDGLLNDWDPILTERGTQLYRNEGEVDASFELILGEQVNDLYGFMKIKDDVPVYRDLNQLNLATADHIRLSYTDARGELARLAWTFSEPGIATVYTMSDDWQEPIAWTPLKDVLGFITRTDSGYDFEFRLPISRLADGRDFKVSFVDVDDESTRQQRIETQTQASESGKRLNLVVLRSVETMKLIESLGFVESKVVIYDQDLRIRGESEGQQPNATEEHQYTTWINRFQLIRPIVHFLTTGESWSDLSQEMSDELTQTSIRDALSGRPNAIKRLSERGAQVVMAAYPIRSQTEVIGAVTVEADIAQILSFQYAAMREIVIVSFVTLLVVLVVSVGFSGRLAYRIRRLRRETSGAIDHVGRLTQSSLRAEVDSGDEIGDLARSIDDMLNRLREHSSFLERMPRTLRHEINNPLNTLSTSLQNLDHASNERERKTYLEVARRGLQRISAIVQNLADAANLEESLQKEDRIPFDISALLKSYVANLNFSHERNLFTFRGPEEPIFVQGSDIYIEQMLDKIVDNAIDFHLSDSQILVQLDYSNDQVRITVGNRGPVFEENTHLLFERLVSHRGSKSSSHFGLGLYVVRVIAEYHGGRVRALNLKDNSGVLVVVELPKYRSPLKQVA